MWVAMELQFANVSIFSVTKLSEVAWKAMPQLLKTTTGCVGLNRSHGGGFSKFLSYNKQWPVCGLIQDADPSSM